MSGQQVVVIAGPKCPGKIGKVSQHTQMGPQQAGIQGRVKAKMEGTREGRPGHGEGSQGGGGRCVPEGKGRQEKALGMAGSRQAWHPNGAGWQPIQAGPGKATKPTKVKGRGKGLCGWYGREVQHNRVTGSWGSIRWQCRQAGETQAPGNKEGRQANA